MEQISFFPLLEKSKKTENFLNCFIYKDLFVFITRKSYERNLCLSVGKKARLQVKCSLSTSLNEIKVFLEEHWIWIQKQIAEQKKLIKKYPLKKFKEGEAFLFQGQNFYLKYKLLKKDSLSYCHFGLNLHFGLNRHSGLNPESLPKTKNSLSNKPSKNSKYLVYYWKKASDLNSSIFKKELINFYKKQGEKVLRKAVCHFSSLMKLFPKSIRISSAKSLWGSCSSDKSLSLNWRLVAAPPSVLNYVVIHELAHLKYLNHSPDFWSLVSRFCPQYKEKEDWLNKNTYAMDFLLPQSELHN